MEWLQLVSMLARDCKRSLMQSGLAQKGCGTKVMQNYLVKLSDEGRYDTLQTSPMDQQRQVPQHFGIAVTMRLYGSVETQDT